MDAVAHRPDDLRYDPGITGADAFARITSAARDHLEANVVPARGGDVEGVHQLRVAIRRLRAALLLFRPVLPEGQAAHLRERLRDIGRLVGLARDWDVFASETIVHAGADLSEAQLQILTRAIKSVRASAHDAIFAFLAEPGFTDLLLEITEFPGRAVVGPSRSAKHRLGEPVAELSAWLLGKLYRRVAKRGHNIKHASLPELHELRKAIKNFRYGTEFLAPLYSPGKIKTVLKPCRELQDLLGRVNDGAGLEQLSELLLAASSEPGLADAVAEIRNWAGRRGDKARDRLLKPWHKLREAAPFW